jgi:hypothetical protein
MLISEVISHASNGVLHQLAIKDKPEVVISFINLGLIDLHKKFLLKVEEHLIDVQYQKSVYSMPDDYMYLLDVSNLGLTDATNAPSDFKVTSVPINSESDSNSIYTPYYNKVQIPSVFFKHTLSLIYAAAPERVISEEDELELPMQLLECLLLYIGYQAYASMDVKALAAENTFYNRYIQACEQVKQLGTVGANSYITHIIHDRGFV